MYRVLIVTAADFRIFLRISCFLYKRHVGADLPNTSSHQQNGFDLLYSIYFYVNLCWSVFDSIILVRPNLILICKIQANNKIKFSINFKWI